jgi:uncharacterized protein YcbK (DUF882 family)
MDKEKDQMSLAELDVKLHAAGVVNFTAHELTYLRKAKPPHHEFPLEAQVENLIRVAVVAQMIRDHVGAPLSVANGYRPSWYNVAVGGKPRSAHTRAAAMDLVARNLEEARRMKAIAEQLWQSGMLDGLGFYGNPLRIHIDVPHVGSKGHRRWHY